MRLFLCEKPSQARDIARIVRATERRDGYYAGPDGIAVSWCVGHLVKLAPPEAYDARYKHWAIEDLPIIPTGPWQLEVTPSTAAQFKVIEHLLGLAHHLANVRLHRGQSSCGAVILP